MTDIQQRISNIIDDFFQICLPYGPYGSRQFIVIEGIAYDGLGRVLPGIPEAIKSNPYEFHDILSQLNVESLARINCALGLKSYMRDTSLFLALFNKLANNGLEYWIDRFNILLVVMSKIQAVNWAAIDEAYAPSFSSNFDGKWSHPALETPALRIWASLYKPGLVEQYSIDIDEEWGGNILQINDNHWIINAGISMKLFKRTSLTKIPVDMKLGDAFEWLTCADCRGLYVSVPSYNIILRKLTAIHPLPLYWEVTHDLESLNQRIIPVTTNKRGPQSARWIKLVDSLSLHNCDEVDGTECGREIALMFKILKTDYYDLTLISNRGLDFCLEINGMDRVLMVAGRFYDELLTSSQARREILWNLIGANPAIVDWTILIKNAPDILFVDWVIQKMGLNENDEDVNSIKPSFCFPRIYNAAHSGNSNDNSSDEDDYYENSSDWDPFL